MINNNEKFGEQTVECKYCHAKDLLWSREQGKWMLIESFGLPHYCDEKRKHFSDIAKEKNEELRKIYQVEKDRLSAIPDDSQCSVCFGSGRVFSIGGYGYGGPPKCNYCLGVGKITSAVKNKLLFFKRKQLWPDMFNRYKKK